MQVRAEQKETHLRAIIVIATTSALVIAANLLLQLVPNNRRAPLIWRPQKRAQDHGHALQAIVSVVQRCCHTTVVNSSRHEGRGRLVCLEEFRERDCCFASTDVNKDKFHAFAYLIYIPPHLPLVS